MEAFTYKGIADGKYVAGDIEAIKQEEASHKLKEQKIIITNLIRSKKKKVETKAKAKGKGFSFRKPKVKVEDVLIFFLPKAIAPEETIKISLSFFNNQATSSQIAARIS